MSVIMVFFKCRQNIFFVKFDSQFVLKYATKILKEKVLTHSSAKFSNFFFPICDLADQVYRTITSNSRRDRRES